MYESEIQNLYTVGILFWIWSLLKATSVPESHTTQEKVKLIDKTSEQTAILCSIVSLFGTHLILLGIYLGGLKNSSVL